LKLLGLEKSKQISNTGALTLFPTRVNTPVRSEGGLLEAPRENTAGNARNLCLILRHPLTASPEKVHL
jgi:hypothetical protein